MRAPALELRQVVKRYPRPPEIEVPEWPQFMRGCVRYRQSLDQQVPAAPRSTKPYEEG